MALSVENARRKLERLEPVDAEFIASGMEGHVFRVGDGRVAKVWLEKSLGEVAPLKHFYERLQTLELPFETPLLTQVQDVDGTVVSLEQELVGTPMRNFVKEDEREPPAFVLEGILTILSALKSKRLRSGDAHLPLLGVTPSRQARLSGPTSVLLAVAERKVERYGAQLRASVPDFDRLYQRTVQQVLELHTEET